MKEGEESLTPEIIRFGADAVVFVETYLKAPIQYRESKSSLDPNSIAHEAEIFFTPANTDRLDESIVPFDDEYEQTRLIRNLFENYENFFSQGGDMSGSGFRHYTNEWLQEMHTVLSHVNTERARSLTEVVERIDLLKIKEFAQAQLTNVESVLGNVPQRYFPEAYEDKNVWNRLLSISNDAYREEKKER
jgi:hypothetical protein